MEFNDLGITIKELRIKKYISQSELCHGICSQSQISKIEKGVIYPSSILLYQLSERLGVDPNNIFALTQNKKLKYVQNVKYVMIDCTKQKQYKELYEIVKKEKNENNFQSREDKQFLLFYEAIAILYAENKEYEKSINILKKCLRNFDNLDFPRDKEIKLKIVFNLTKCFNLMDQYQESIKYSDKGIKIAINLNTLYLLGELCYFKASNLLKLKHPNEEAVVNNMKKALFIFELTEKEHYIQMIKEKLIEIQNKKHS
ncbi:TPA: helix-turn-helix domain-containing protein [Bacillus cereus]